jgi:hypothetical protein
MRFAVCLVVLIIASLPSQVVAAEPPLAEGEMQLQLGQQPKQEIPNDDTLVILITSTLAALNQANITGNYTVFRDLASPKFQEANNAARLSEIFSDLRNSGFDFSSILLLSPDLVKEPRINDQGMLRLTGLFDTKPQLNFEMLFERVEDKWLLFGIGVTTDVKDSPPSTER